MADKSNKDSSKNKKNQNADKKSALNATDGTKTDSTEAVLIRNYAVYVVYRKLIFISLLALILSACSAFLAWQFMSQKSSPQYVQLDDQGRLLVEKPLDKQDRQDGEVFAYALDAVKKINTYDYINIKDQLNESSKFFTPTGWHAFLAQYTDSKTAVMVRERRMIVSSEITGDPQVKRSGVIGGVNLPDGTVASIFTWAIDIPCRITYTAHSGNKTDGDDSKASGYSGELVQDGVLHLLVMRIPSNILPKGIGIASYNLEITKK